MRAVRSEGTQMWDVGITQHFTNLSAALAGEITQQCADRCRARPELFDDVRRVAGRRDGEQDVARLSECTHLPLENCLETVVVGDGGRSMSVVSAMAASPWRSISKRPTSSAAKCCASAAEPPLPQARICRCRRGLATMASTAPAIGAASIRWLRAWCALSENC